MWDDIHVRCWSCGGDQIMPAEGPVSDWETLEPIVTRFARLIAARCQYAQTLRRCGPDWPQDIVDR